MKVFGLVGTTLLLLLLGTGISAYAQQDQHEDAKPQAQEEEKPKQDEAKPAKREEDKNIKQEKEEKKDENGRKQEERNEAGKAERAQDEHHMQAAQDHDGRGGRIPDDKFRAHFGREHRFHIGHPVIVEGRPRFEYGGYSFVMVDPWPVEWAYTDEVYVDYVDGIYYLINPVHPGVRIVVNVVF
jgi:hypothetical protein